MKSIKLNTYPTDSLCRVCGCKKTIQRNNNEKREIFNEKTLYCIKCRVDTIHLEAPFHKSFNHVELY